MKVATWNLNGIRARHPQLLAFAAEERPDVLCLQELKAERAQIPDPLTTLGEYWSYWHGGPKGYSGVSLHLRRDSFPAEPKFTVPSIDRETRLVQAEVCGMVFASCYAPNGGKDFEAKMAFYRDLVGWARGFQATQTPLILSGDMNITRTDDDVHPSQVKKGVIGQRDDERLLFAELLGCDLLDVGRHLHPEDKRLFTWWAPWRNLREKNVGWRIDYVLATQTLGARACSYAARREFGTSDHAPVLVEFDVTL